MAHLANAGGNTLTQLAIMALVFGLIAMAAMSPAVRAGVRDFLSGLRENPVGRFFYGSAQDDETDEKSEEQDEDAPTDEEEDDFDYSIYAQSNPATDQEP